MRAQIFQHVPFEGPGSISDFLRERGAGVSITRFFAGEKPPPVEDFDFLIVMGGPMSVNDDALHPWLRMEKARIREAIEAGKSVLGICLGAQLIAAALGAEVYPNPVKEIGWFPILGNPVGSPFRLSETLTVFHWHGETFALPPGCERLASSPECENQAFALRGQNVVGLQFHLETTPEALIAIIENCRHELTPGPKVMSEAEMKAVALAHFTPIHLEMNRLLDALTHTLNPTPTPSPEQP